MIVKVHEQGNTLLLAMCDKDLLGKTIKKGDIEIKIGDFYNGEEVSDDAALDLIKTATIINAIGRESVNILVKNNFITEENVLDIGGIPHAQIFKMFE